MEYQGMDLIISSNNYCLFVWADNRLEMMILSEEDENGYMQWDLLTNCRKLKTPLPIRREENRHLRDVNKFHNNNCVLL